MLSITTLASGSGGNCLLVSGGDTHILIDAGISCRRITAGLHTLGLDPCSLSAILITHEHSDHICGLATLLRKCPAPVCASPGTARALERRLAFPEGRLRPIPVGEVFSAGELVCRSFPTSHDAAQSTGYTVSCGEERMALVTDLGYVSDEVRQAVLGCHILVVELNHDEDWLRSGPYPFSLQQRILGPRGHLCNEAGADLAVQAAQAGAHTILLAHLSRENNTPARALEVARCRLAAAGFSDLTLSAVPVCGLSPTYFAVREGALC